PARFQALPFRRSVFAKLLIIHRTRLQYPPVNPMTAMPILMSYLNLSQVHPPSSWFPILLPIIIGISLTAANITLSIPLGPRRPRPAIPHRRPPPHGNARLRPHPPHRLLLCLGKRRLPLGLERSSSICNKVRMIS